MIYDALLSVGGGGMAGKNVTRVDLCSAAYDRVRLSRLEAMSLVEAVLDQITGTLAKGENVKLSSFGSFIVRNKRQRIGRNPRTGAEATITPRRIVVFKPSAILKQQINRKQSDTKTTIAVLGSAEDSGEALGRRLD